MNARLIVPALASLLATPAIAQSNVTLYGVADVGVGYGASGDSRFSGVVDGVLSGPRVGFKGSEDLGNGLSAVFVLEQGFDVGSGAPASTRRQFHRQSWAGIMGGFGTLGVGRQYAPGYGYTGRLSGAVPGSVFNTQAFLVNAIPGATIHPGSDARWDNSVRYQFGGRTGLAAEAIYAFEDDQSGDGRGDDDRFGAGVSYGGDWFAAGVVYHRSRRAGDDLEELYAGGSYDLGVVELFASYQTARRGEVVDASVAYLGGAVPVGGGKLVFDLARLTDDENDDNDSTAVTVGYTHALSKRTTLYALANRTANGDKASRGVFAGEAGQGSTSAGIGMRHQF